MISVALVYLAFELLDQEVNPLRRDALLDQLLGVFNPPKDLGLDGLDAGLDLVLGGDQVRGELVLFFMEFLQAVLDHTVDPLFIILHLFTELENREKVFLGFFEFVQAVLGLFVLL